MLYELESQYKFETDKSNSLRLDYNPLWNKPARSFFSFHGPSSHQAIKVMQILTSSQIIFWKDLHGKEVSLHFFSNLFHLSFKYPGNWINIAVLKLDVEFILQIKFKLIQKLFWWLHRKSQFNTRINHNNGFVHSLEITSSSSVQRGLKTILPASTTVRPPYRAWI